VDLEIRKQNLHALFVALLEVGAFTEVALSLRRFVRQDVVLERLLPADLAGGGLPEALRRASIRLHLGHRGLLVPGFRSDSIVLQDLLAARTCILGGVVPHPAHAASVRPPDPSFFDGLSEQEIVSAVRAILLQDSSVFIPDHHRSFWMIGFTTRT
jgi:hypothetical protein